MSQPWHVRTQKIRYILKINTPPVHWQQEKKGSRFLYCQVEKRRFVCSSIPYQKHNSILLQLHLENHNLANLLCRLSIVNFMYVKCFFDIQITVSRSLGDVILQNNSCWFTYWKKNDIDIHSYKKDLL